MDITLSEDTLKEINDKVRQFLSVEKTGQVAVIINGFNGGIADYEVNTKVRKKTKA